MDLKQIETLLTVKLATLEDRLNDVKKDVAKPHSTDSSEQAQERENDEVLEEIGRETENAIAAINTALAKIRNGTYGACSVCGGAIAQERLEAIPETVSCVSCAASLYSG